ncbi:MAG: hypothetical protein RLZZ324_47 [Candidatus Parcubacteria bacterium]
MNARPSNPASSRRVFITLCGIIGAGALWYLFWSPAFQASTIEVSGVSKPTEDAIRAGLQSHLQGRLLGIIPHANLIVFDSGSALHDIAGRVQLGGIALHKKLPDTLVVTATEKVARAALDWHDRLYALDADGVVIRELSATEIGALGDLPPRMDAVAVAGLGAQSVPVGGTAQDAPVTKTTVTPKTPGAAAIAAAMKGDAAPDAQGGPVPLIMVEEALPGTADAKDAVPGATMVPGTAMRLILQAYSRLPDIAGTKVSSFLVRASSETVEGVMAGDWRVLMSSALPFDVQGERLGIILREKIGAQKAQLEYVDLRYNERIFFRMKGQGNGAADKPAPSPTAPVK